MTALLSAALPSAAHAQELLDTLVDVVVEGGNEHAWQRVELPGTTCGNGSQYRLFIRRTSSPNVLFLFEGGGACWDYDTCSGRAGVLGAANPNGIPDDYMERTKAQYASPIVNGADPGIPLRSRTDLVTKGWNIVYMPYCTGDVHIGDSVVTYTDPTGEEPPITWHHSGYNNTIAAASYAKAQLPRAQKLLVTGYSAGDAATSSSYYFVRSIMNPQRGYLLNDSGPIHLASNLAHPSRALHDTIQASWALDAVLEALPPSFDPDDLGSINRAVVTAFPGDRLAYTGYTRDFIYSRFSYERFHEPNDQESVLARWKADQDRLVAS